MTQETYRAELENGLDPAVDRARGALLGLAFGDAAGHPSLMHRAIRVPGVRSRMWTVGHDADRHRVTRYATPYHLTVDFAARYGPSDDAEAAAIGAELLLTGPLDDPRALAQRWASLCGEDETDPARKNWMSLGERGALTNLARGLEPPAVGQDHPHGDDDAAVPRAVPAGIRYADQPKLAVREAGRLAEISHADDGVWAAQAMAAAVAAAVRGADARAAVMAGAAVVPTDSWLGRNLQVALAFRADDPLGTLPEITERMVNGHYSYGCLAPETVPLAFHLVRATGGVAAHAVPLAALVHRQADSLPAIVGALCGALQGAAALPASWRARVDTLAGVCVPRLAGRRLTELADALVTDSDTGTVR